jgi:hypothetical protein
MHETGILVHSRNSFGFLQGIFFCGEVSGLVGASREEVEKRHSAQISTTI